MNDELRIIDSIVCRAFDLSEDQRRIFLAELPARIRVRVEKLLAADAQAANRFPMERRASPVVRFVVETDSGERTHAVFDTHQTWVVGRSRSAHTSLPDDVRCSRFHCRFEVAPPECVVTDLRSTNGTFVNGTRIHVPTMLTSDDEVQVGGSRIRVIMEGPENSRDHVEPTLIIGSTQETGPQIPGFRVGGQLGKGGMGTVYRAIQKRTGRQYAVKVLCPIRLEAAGGLPQFLREASIATRLKHPNIVRSKEIGLVNRSPYIVMELVNVVNLQELLKRMSAWHRVRVSAGLVCRLLAALQYAHERDVVHRDVKPSNMLAFDRQGKLGLRLTDFGLAKNYVDAGLTSLSRSGDIKGTIAYMSPEQILDCRYATPQCDIYSAGACLYEFVCGQKPYDITDPVQGLTRVLNEPPIPISDRMPDLPPEIVMIIQKAMHRDLSHRFASAEEMRIALQEFYRKSGRS